MQCHAMYMRCGDDLGILETEDASIEGAEAGVPKLTRTKLGKSDCEMQRMHDSCSSEMTAFWKEIPCNPSTRTWERDDGSTIRDGRERPPAEGPEATHEAEPQTSRYLQKEARAQDRDTSSSCSSRRRRPRKSRASRCGSSRGRREMWSRVHSTGHRQRSRGDRPRPGSVLSQTPCDG